MPRQLLIALRAIPIGWVTLLALAFLVERPVLKLIGPILGADWIATASLGLDCAALAATGWVVGRLSRPVPILGVLTFAATLLWCDFTALLAIDIPWLLRLAIHTLSGDGGSFNSLVSTAASQALLFGCLVSGGLLSRAPAEPVSIAAV
jgi:hypothetical protein